VKQLVAILFSLLLIVAQTLAVALSVSSGPCVAKAGCCCCGGENCQCHVGQGGDSPVPPVESTVPSSAFLNFMLFPAGPVLFEIALAASPSSAPCAATLLSAASQPLFRLNCALLI
jgi:hypothetical protein